MKKVLITYASAGDGHKKAAEAIYKSFLGCKDAKVISIDALNYTTRFFKFFYKRTYIVMIKRFPWLWGFFYQVLNNRFFFLIAAPFRSIVNHVNSKRLKEFLIKENFDIIISTHFFAPYVISRLKEQGKVSARLINVVTDFRLHLFWIEKNVDKYIVATESTKQDFLKRGIDKDKIIALGIPVRKQFTNISSQADARSTLGIAEDKFTILIMRGGLGVGPIKDILLNLQRLDMDFQVIAVCGHNNMLKQELKLVAENSEKSIKIIGFSHNVAVLMAASDIMISKAGGITVSESLSVGLPIISINPIPGQETGNADFLIKNEIGFIAKDLNEINNIIDKFYRLPDERDKLKNNIKDTGRPSAAEGIVKLALEMTA
jgi:processive 1,2-diacylglycerol beta-glucosyltransferase